MTIICWGIGGNVLAETWLNIPQAVVLEATGDLVRARSLEAADPFLLLMKAVRLLPPILSSSIAGASDAETRTAFMARVGEAEVQAARGGYERALRAVGDKLVNGVTAKGRRAPHLPLEIIDPAEFTRLELRNLDAVDPRTGKTVWHGLLISARKLSKSGSPDRPPPLSDRDLHSWYEERVSRWAARGEAASGEADWEAARQQFPRRVTRARVRALRQQLAPVDWKKQGRRSIRLK